MPIIKPTIGRKVWFFETASHAARFAAGEHEAQPFDATVIFVHDARCVNIRYTTPTGAHGFMPGCPLVQEGDAPANGAHCQWMPYQQGQATKAELDEKIKALSDGSTVNPADAITSTIQADDPLFPAGKDAKALIGDALNDGGGESLDLEQSTATQAQALSESAIEAVVGDGAVPTDAHGSRNNPGVKL